MPRLFIAVDVGEAQRAQIEALIAAETQALPIAGARWATAAQLHVTVRFLGSVADARVGEIRASLAAVAAGGFQLALASAGAFPEAATRKPARVLWVGLQPLRPLQDLKAAVDAALGPDPECVDRVYSPHLTLARVPGLAPIARDTFLARHAGFASAPWPVTHFRLYESKTLPGGPAYQVLQQYPLR
jgi:2'-5' RNA ligase